MGLQVVKDTVSKVIDAHLLDLGKRDIDLTVGTHLLDKGSEAVTDVHVLIGLVLVNLSPMGIVDNNAVAQVAALHHQHFHLLAVVVVGVSVIEEFGKLGTGDNAVAGFVKIDAHDVAATGLHVDALLAEGHQQILGNQTPIQEGAHLVHRLNAHEGEIAHHGLGLLGGRYRPVLAVVIDKDTDGVAHLHVRGKVTLGQQHLVGILVNQISAKINHSVDAQLIIFSNLHIETMIFFAKFVKKIHFSTWF